MWIHGEPSRRDAGSNNSWWMSALGLLTALCLQGQDAARCFACNSGRDGPGVVPGSAASGQKPGPAPQHAPREEGLQPHWLHLKAGKCLEVPPLRAGTAGPWEPSQPAEAAELLGQGHGCSLH